MALFKQVPGSPGNFWFRLHEAWLVLTGERIAVRYKVVTAAEMNIRSRARWAEADKE